MSNAAPADWSIEPIGNSILVLTDYTANGSFASLKENVTYYNAPNYAALVRTTDLEKRDFLPERFTDRKGFEFLKKSELFPGDIVIANVGSAGKAYRVPAHFRPMTLAPNMYLVKFSDKMNEDFAFQVITSDRFQEKLLESCANTTLKAINKTSFRNIEVAVPPLPEQQKIAAILSSVDDVIEKTRAQIDKLKDLKTGMMQELLTKGIGSGGVPHTEFKDSPVGRIPSSWNVRSLGALSSFVTSGSRGWAQYYSNSGAIFIRIGNLTREHINLRFDDTVYVTPPASAEGKRTQVTIGDVLISITADLGVIGVVNESIGEAFVNQHISLVRLNEPVLARWVGHFLAFENSQKQFIANNDAGAKAGLNLTAIRKTLVAIPAKEEREKIVASLDSVDKDVSLQRDRLQRLMNLKRALMQDLLTGKVRVKVDQKESAVA